MAVENLLSFMMLVCWAEAVPEDEDLIYWGGAFVGLLEFSLFDTYCCATVCYSIPAVVLGLLVVMAFLLSLRLKRWAKVWLKRKYLGSLAAGWPEGCCPLFTCGVPERSL